MQLVSHYGDLIQMPMLTHDDDNGGLMLSWATASAPWAQRWQHERLGCTDILYHVATGFTVTVTLGSFEGGSYGLVSFVVGGHGNAPVTRVFKLRPPLDTDYLGCVNDAIQGLLINQLCINGQWRLPFTSHKP